MPAIFLILLELCQGKTFRPLPLSKNIKTNTESPGEPCKYPAFNVSIFQDIFDIMCQITQHVEVFRLGLCVFPKSLLIPNIRPRLQNRRLRIPFVDLQEIHVGLGCQKVRVEAVPQLMGKQPADQIVAVGPNATFGDNRMSGIDLDGQVIGACDDVLFWFPHQVHMNAPIIFVAACLSYGHIFKMERQDSGRKKLPVRNLAALFIEKLLDTLVIHSCQRVKPPFFRYAVADFRLGAKIGSRMVLISASRSSSSAVALLMMV